jgi:hypothetical protein
VLTELLRLSPIAALRLMHLSMASALRAETRWLVWDKCLVLALEHIITKSLWVRMVLRGLCLQGGLKVQDLTLIILGQALIRPKESSLLRRCLTTASELHSETVLLD